MERNVMTLAKVQNIDVYLSKMCHILRMRVAFNFSVYGVFTRNSLDLCYT